jgi:hypothetical protein
MVDDLGATTHISVSMQGCQSYRKLKDRERYIYIGDDNKAEVEVIGHFRLLLKTSLYLDLFDTFVRHSNMVTSGFLSIIDNLYALDTITSYNETFINEI